MTNAVMRSDFGGRVISDYHSEMLNEERGYEFNRKAQREIVREMKAKSFFISPNFGLEV